MHDKKRFGSLDDKVVNSIIRRKPVALWIYLDIFSIEYERKGQTT